MKKVLRPFGQARLAVLLVIFAWAVSVLPSLTLVNENIQNWTAHSSYGTYTQEISAGVVSMTSCLVSPNAAATGTCSIGRIQCQATTGIVQFPSLPSVGQVEFHFAAGSSGRSIKLQRLNGSTWEDITTFTNISATGATYAYDVNIADSVSLRLAVPSNALYVHDIIITDYQNVDLPIVTTSALANITYNTAVSGGNVDNSGSSAVTARGVCWSRLSDPVALDSLTVSGSGIGSFTSLISGLTADTEYHVRAFATNSSGTSYGEDILFRTLNIGVPSVQASNLVLYPGSTSLQASWTPGNGFRRIVKINTANNFTLPVNGQNYTPNSVYSGSGEQVVYNGETIVVEGEAINSVSVTNLTPNTLYWLRVFDYNGSDSSIQYNTQTASGNPVGTTTLNAVLEGYYAGISGTGTALKNNLSNLIRTTHLTEFSYDGVWTQLQYTDEDSTNTNNIIEEYTGWSVPKSYNGGGTSQWNREHTWSKSHGDFGEVAPAGTDLHHLRPADSTVNSAKGNKDFDNGGNPVVDSSPYTGYSGTTGCYTDPDSWEPRATEKGDVARMLMYMAVRYEGVDTSYNLELQDTTPTSGPFYGKLSTLLQWHMQDPPDGWERRRNNRIQERQGNRNPFIDHPEYARMIWAPTAVNASDIDSTSFIANWSQPIIASYYTLDVATDSLFTSYVAGYHDLNVGTASSYSVTGLNTNATYYYRLRSFFTVGYSMYSNIASAYVSSFPSITGFSSTWLDDGLVVYLSWTAASESDLSRYYLYRSTTANLADAEIASPESIPAHNLSEPYSYLYSDTGVNSNTMYHYWLKAVKTDDSFHYYGPIQQYVGTVANQDETQAGISPAIRNVYPNPFHLSASIELNLPKAGNINLRVYNLKGQCVRTLFSGVKSTGVQTIALDGTSTNGSRCKPGIYFIRLNSGKASSQKKVILY